MRKKLFTAFAAISCCAVLFTAGCSVSDLRNTVENNNTQTTAQTQKKETATPSTSTADGNITMKSRWYDKDGKGLKKASIAIYNGNKKIYSGTTDMKGNLATCVFPSNTRLHIKVTDYKAQTLADSYIDYTVSADYQSMEVTPVNSSSVQEIHIPSGRTNVVSAFFINKSKEVETANIYQNRQNSTSSGKES